MASIIQLKTNDGEIFKVDVKFVTRSKLIMSMLELSADDDGDSDPVPLPRVRGPVFRKILEWAEHHLDDPMTFHDAETEKQNFIVDPWDTQFIQVDFNMLIELMNAANFLAIEQLLALTHYTIAHKIKDKTRGELRQYYDRGREAYNVAQQRAQTSDDDD